MGTDKEPGWCPRSPSQEQVAEAHGLHVDPAIAEAGAEEGAVPLRRDPVEGEEVGHVPSVEEGDSALLAIQEDPHFPEGPSGSQAHPGGGGGPVLRPVPQAKRPVAVVWAQLDLRRPVHGLGGHPQVPLGFAAHPDLPVVPAAVEGLRAQDVDALAEAPGAAGDRLGLIPLRHCCQVSGEDQVGVG